MADAALSQSAHLLDPAVVARLGTMELKARTIVEGLTLGLHRSPYHGFSTEFAEYRPYVTGDDHRVDRLEGLRAERPLLRQEVGRGDQPRVPPPARHERVDGLRQRRADQARLRRHAGRGDRLAGVGPARRRRADRLRRARPPAHAAAASGPGHLHQILLALEKVRPSAGSDVAKPLQRAGRGARAPRPRSCSISDLLDDPEDGRARGLTLLGARGMEVVVFHLLDEAELTFPFEGPLLFKDLESADEVLAVPGRRAAALPRRARAPQRRLRARLERRRHGLPDGVDRDAARRVAARLPPRASRRTLMLAFLSPWFLAGRARGGVADRAAPAAQGRPRRRTSSRRSASCAGRRSRRGGRGTCATCCCWRCVSARSLLLAAAFARPYLGGAGRGRRPDARRGRHLVQHGRAGPHGEGARGRGAQAIAAAPAGDRVAVIRVDDRATVVAEPSLDRGAARAAIGDARRRAAAPRPTRRCGAPRRASPARRAAASCWSATSRSSIRPAPSPRGSTLEVVDVGGPVENLSVGPARRDGDAHRRRGHEPRHPAAHGAGRAGRQRLTRWPTRRSRVDPGAHRSVRLAARLPSTGVARVSVADPEGMPADDARYLVLDPPPLSTVPLLGEAGSGDDLFLLRAAIESGGPGRGFAVEMLGGDARARARRRDGARRAR